MNILKTFSVICLSLVLTSVAYAADIQVKVDRSHIELNETFTLVFEASEAVDDDPDFSPLEKDFQVLNQSTSSNISIINGQYTRNQRWSVSLLPLREGSITIPSISFGSDTSPQYQVTIKPVQKSSEKSGAEFMSELDISTDSSYPQAQIIVTQRLLSSRNINGYEFSKLQFSGVDVDIEPLGELKQYQTRRGNTNYLVLEQHFAVFPQTAGELTIEPSIATARLALNNKRNSYDPFRSNTKTVRRASAKKSIDVMPVPGTFKGRHWLVANEVQLVEEFPEGENFKPGDPITRTISILADGQSSSQLPEFKITDIKNLKQYPDQPLLNNNVTEKGITGIQQIKVAIIPSQAGSYTLPEISVPWWNIKTGKMEIAKVKQRSFDVGSAAAGSSTPASQPAQPATQPITAIDTPAQPELDITGSTENTTTEDTTGSALWKLLSLLLFIAWLVTIFLFWKQKRSINQTDTSTAQATPSLKTSYKQLENACQKSDAQACKVALLYWANALFENEPVYSLGELAKRVDAPLAEQINNLNSLLYKNQPEQWQAGELFASVKQFADTYQTKSGQENNDDKLEPLYK